MTRRRPTTGPIIRSHPAWDAEFDREFARTERIIRRAWIACGVLTVVVLGGLAWAAVVLVQWVTSK